MAAVRRNSRLAWLKKQEATETASESMHSAFADLKDSMIDTWSESMLKEFCDKNGITGTSSPLPQTPTRTLLSNRFGAVPQGTKLNELRALVRKHRARVLGEDVAGHMGAASTKAGNEWAKATDSAAMIYQEAFERATSSWSHSRLKSFLDARGIVGCPGPHTNR